MWVFLLLKDDSEFGEGDTLDGALKKAQVAIGGGHQHFTAGRSELFLIESCEGYI